MSFAPILTEVGPAADRPDAALIRPRRMYVADDTNQAWITDGEGEWLEIAGTGGGGDDPVNLALEVTEAAQNTHRNNLAADTEITGPASDWTAIMEGDQFTGFDPATNRVFAKQDGRYRVSWNFYLDVKANADGRIQFGVDIKGDTFGLVRRTQGTTHFVTGDGEVTFTHEGSRVVDLVADEQISATAKIAGGPSGSRFDIAGAAQFGFVGTAMTLEYLGPNA